MTTVDGGKSLLAKALDQYGLSSLTDWAYEQMLKGVSMDQIMLDLPKTPEYQARFPAMAQLSSSGRAISEAQYIGYENAVRGIMRNSGLPPAFYNEPGDFASLLISDVSVAEVEQRVNNAYAKIAQAPQDVRDAFGQMYGANSDDAFAAFVLDPERAQPIIQKQVNAALVTAQGGRIGLDISKGMAETVSSTMAPDQAQQAVRQAGGLRPLTEQTLMEQQQGSVLTGDELLAGITGLTSAEKSKKALESRAAQFQGQGGAVQSKEGVFGLGGSQQ